MNTCFKVTIAREHRRTDQIVAHNGFVELCRKIAGITNAGGAAVGRYAKAKLFKVGQKACLGEVVGDDTTSGCKRGFNT